MQNSRYMGATLKLDRFQLMWLFEGACGKSHLRWDIYSMFVNDVFPQLSENEREFMFTYIKRDCSWHFSGQHIDETAHEMFKQTLARFNPSNQYRVTVKRGREKAIVAENAYLWDGKYYIGWNRYCDERYIKKVEHKPYRKCHNELCKSNSCCLRYMTHGDVETTKDGLMLENILHSCDKCDLIIEDAKQG